MNFRGIIHLALVTNDMEGTVRFYRDLLGMPLVAAVVNNKGGYPFRHYFFETGPNNCIAFFEWPEIQVFNKPVGMPANGPVQFDHVSFDVETPEELFELREKLETAGVEVTDVVDHKFIHSVYFHDNNGIALEVSVWINNVTGNDPQYHNRYVFQDEDPVPALAEQINQLELADVVD